MGKCTKTTTRTSDNDNDKANKYFRDPEETLKKKYSALQLQTIEDGTAAKVDAASEGNELIEKLRQQSVDNKEKNDMIVRVKTIQNDLVRRVSGHVFQNVCF